MAGLVACLSSLTKIVFLVTTAFSFPTVGEGGTCIGCKSDQICCNYDCVDGSSCVGYDCDHDQDCSSYEAESCCKISGEVLTQCVSGSSCTGQSCSADADCSVNEQVPDRACCDSKCVQGKSCLGRHCFPIPIVPPARRAAVANAKKVLIAVVNPVPATRIVTVKGNNTVKANVQKLTVIKSTIVKRSMATQWS